MIFTFQKLVRTNVINTGSLEKVAGDGYPRRNPNKFSSFIVAFF